MTIQLVAGDCREVMGGMQPDVFDAIVCDPPYDLLQQSRNGSGRSNPGPGPYGRTSGAGGFMGMAWDATGVAFDPETWRIVSRVLKPGGYLVAFGGTRTFHRLTCAIEDAGFEIRDVLSWLYGAGFPKSLDVSKAIDKAAGAERNTFGSSRPEMRVAYGRGAGAVRCDLCGNSRNGTSCSCPLPAPITAPAREWDGWGTALKPAWEPIILARKPLSESTVAANVLRWGTGALNVDGCRLPTDWIAERGETWLRSGTSKPDYMGRESQGPASHTNTVADRVSSLGRWPANVVLDEGAAGVLDEQSGEHGLGRSDYARPSTVGGWFTNGSSKGGGYPGETGGASRFFYTAKASQSERNERVRQVGGTNSHPTVKPVGLMRWLCRMVTRPGGHILDPFVGSGSTLVAALLEGFDATGIDLSPEYIELARKRIDGIQMGGLMDLDSA